MLHSLYFNLNSQLNLHTYHTHTINPLHFVISSFSNIVEETCSEVQGRRDQ